MIKVKEFKAYKDSADYIKSKIDFRPEIAIILGTALGGLADDIEDEIVIDYADIPGFLISTNEDHAGKLILGKLYGKNVVCMSGRFHYYEGYDFTELVSPVRVFKLLGVEKLIVTNAAGGINKGYRPGDIMLITDHLNFMGVSPTRGKNIDEFGSRFFDMSNAYNRELLEIARECKSETKLRIQEGIYSFASGPQFETPAEIKFMRIVGADAVGMSTVPEVITAAQCGIKVLGISLISNMAAGVLNQPISGEEVEETGKTVRIELKKYIKEIIIRL